MKIVPCSIRTPFLPVLLDHRIYMVELLLFLLAHMLQLIRLLFENFIDSESHLSFLKYFFELTNYLSLLFDSFLH